MLERASIAVRAIAVNFKLSTCDLLFLFGGCFLLSVLVFPFAFWPIVSVFTLVFTFAFWLFGTVFTFSFGFLLRCCCGLFFGLRNNVFVMRIEALPFGVERARVACYRFWAGYVFITFACFFPLLIR